MIKSIHNYSTYLFELKLNRKHNSSSAILGITNISLSILENKIKEICSPTEIDFFHAIDNKKLKDNFLRSRYIAKTAIAQFTNTTNLNTIAIRKGIFGQPLINGTNRISIAHSGLYAACIVFPDEHNLGIDLEAIRFNAIEAINSQLTAAEINIIKNLTQINNVSYMRLWTSKEALSKILQTGLMMPFELLEINSAEIHKNYHLFYFKNFIQYKSMSFIFNNMAMSIVLPTETKIKLSKTSKF